jgi:hypothetical protein
MFIVVVSCLHKLKKNAYKTEMRVFSTFVSTIPNLEDLPIKKLEIYIFGNFGVYGYVFLSSTMIRWICLKRGIVPQILSQPHR